MRARLDAYSAYGPAGASAKVRLWDWFDHLGVDAVWHQYLGMSGNAPGRLLRRPLATLVAESRLRTRQPIHPTVLVSREASPLSLGHLEAGLLRRARHGVFDLDDAIYLPVPGPRGVLGPETKAGRAAAAADVVIAGNEVLADWARSYADEVVVVPSCVEPDAYTPKRSYRLGDPPRLVWLGSPSTEQYLVEVAAALREVCRATGARLSVISGPSDGHRPLDRALPGLRRVRWSPEVARDELAAADVALAPLADTPYARGKCAYKLLQYAATGLPIVGSPVGANRRALALFDGLSAESHHDWVDALTTLLAESTDRRSDRGKTAVRAVAEHYSFGRWAATWSAAVLGSDA